MHILENTGKQIVYATTGVLAVVALLTGFRFTPVWERIEYYLDVGAAAQSADYIIILDGHPDRLERGANLYFDGYAPKIIIGIVSLERIAEHRDYLLEVGVLEEDIIANCCGTSTWEEAHAHLQLLQTLGGQSALVVTHWQHTRRSRAIYEHLIDVHDLDITVTVISAPHTEGMLSNDQFVLNEYIKIAYYRWRYDV